MVVWGCNTETDYGGASEYYRCAELDKGMRGYVPSVCVELYTNTVEAVWRRT